MELLNRSAITVTYKEPIILWNNKLIPELPIAESEPAHSSTYLIPDLSGNPEVVVKKYYRQIFETELFQVWTDENDWPKISLKLFNQWFSVVISGWTYDLSNKPLLSDSFED